MRQTLLLLGVVLASGCAQPYGSQDCKTDKDCASLGLKKPACATDLCSGTKSCVDSPF